MKVVSQEYHAAMEPLQVVDFVLTELTLYLDTHPGDLQAIAQYNQYARLAEGLRQQFEARFGPLAHGGRPLAGQPWTWAEGPWPWQV